MAAVTLLILNYLVAGPERIIAIDLNDNHIALTRLKLQALEHLPDHESFFRFFSHAKCPLAQLNINILRRMSYKAELKIMYYTCAVHGNGTENIVFHKVDDNR